MEQAYSGINKWSNIFLDIKTPTLCFCLVVLLIISNALALSVLFILLLIYVATQSFKKKTIKKVILAKDGTRIVLYCVYPPTEGIKGVLFVPPLVGGSYLQQYSLFSGVAKEGYIFISYNHRGHKNSDGKFCVKKALEDSALILKVVKETFSNYDIYGIGACFGAISILFNLGKDKHAFRKIALVNAIDAISFVCNPWQAIKLYFLNKKWSAIFSIRSQKMLYAITSTLLPHIDQSMDHFGIMAYKNAKLKQFFMEYLFYRPDLLVRNIHCPSICLYGEEDSLLGLDDPSRQRKYEKRMCKHISNIYFVKYKADHFWTNNLKFLNESISVFFRA